MCRLPADFWTAIEKGIQHLSQETKESTSPPLPFQILVNPIRNHQPRAALKEQTSTKWMNIYKGLRGTCLLKRAERTSPRVGS
jgi:hypothetical protein